MTVVAKLLKAAKKLDVDERTILAHRIWNSVEKECEDTPLSDALKAELDRRMQDHRKHPEKAIPLERVLENLKRLKHERVRHRKA